MTDKTTEIYLTDKEEEIMLILWQHGAMFVKDIVELMPEPRPHFNTISTYVRNLERKGYVSHNSLSGSYQYYAIKPIKEYRRHTVGNMVRNFFNNSYKRAVCSLVEYEKLSLDELRELIEIMESNQNKKS